MPSQRPVWAAVRIPFVVVVVAVDCELVVDIVGIVNRCKLYERAYKQISG